VFCQEKVTLQVTTKTFSLFDILNRRFNIQKRFVALTIINVSD
jgi:hypothetical protein